MFLGKCFWAVSSTAATFVALFATAEGVKQFQTRDEERFESRGFLHKPPSRNRNFGDWLRDLGYELKTSESDFSSDVDEFKSKGSTEYKWLEEKIKRNTTWAASLMDKDKLKTGCGTVHKTLLTDDKESGLEMLKKFCYRQISNRKST